MAMVSETDIAAATRTLATYGYTGLQAVSSLAYGNGTSAALATTASTG